MDQETVTCTLVRGGTSKGVFVQEGLLPERNRDQAILTLFGSPESRQIDGLGGATSTTSKLMIVGESDEEGVDAEFTFGQVSVDQPVVDYGGTCGNLTFGIGPFAIDEGIVVCDNEATEVTLTLYNTNTDSYVEQTIPVQGGETRTKGDFTVYGVPRTYARIDSKFLEPAGGETGSLFPLGGPTVELDTADGRYEVSIVDVVNPVVFARPEAVGLSGTELPEEVDSDPELLARIERLRGAACEALGYVDDVADSADVSPGVPKLAFVAPPETYTTSNGDTVEESEIDMVARIMSMQNVHPVYAVSGASCTAAAALLPGTVPNRTVDLDDGVVTIGHPKGPMTVTADVNADSDTVRSVEVSRTQRRLMDGTGYFVPEA